MLSHYTGRNLYHVVMVLLLLLLVFLFIEIWDDLWSLSCSIAIFALCESLPTIINVTLICVWL